MIAGTTLIGQKSRAPYAYTHVNTHTKAMWENKATSKSDSKTESKADKHTDSKRGPAQKSHLSQALDQRRKAITGITDSEQQAERLVSGDVHVQHTQTKSKPDTDTRDKDSDKTSKGDAHKPMTTTPTATANTDNKVEVAEPVDFATALKNCENFLRIRGERASLRGVLLVLCCVV